MSFVGGLVLGFLGAALAAPMALALARLLSIYVIVREREAKVFLLFGEVIGVVREPGLHFLWGIFGVRALLIGFFGRVVSVSLSLDQVYLRSQPVNSAEGAPMGIGVWYEMQVHDPVSFLFKNTDPRGSLRANVGSSTVRALSNMQLEDMLETRHQMSALVRDEVAPSADEWGFRLGSVYIRKVHFRDLGMIRQIEEKVVNRLRQVTGAIRQDGANQVSLITNTAERQAAFEFGRAAALRPNMMSELLQAVTHQPEVGDALFEVLEAQRLIACKGELTLVPVGSKMLSAMIAGES